MPDVDPRSPSASRQTDGMLASKSTVGLHVRFGGDTALPPRTKGWNDLDASA